MKIHAKAPPKQCCTELVRELTLTAQTPEQMQALAALHERLIKPGALTKIVQDLRDVAELRRFQMNLMQDAFENAYVEITLLDAARQALHETNPDHPFLKKPMPGFGVWESQRREIDRLEAQLRELRALKS
jgi:hypothetical protein